MCLQRKYFKPPKIEVSPQFLKNIKKIERKGNNKERKVTYLLFTLYLIWTGGGLLAFFDDGPTTFRNKINRIINYLLLIDVWKIF